MLTLAYTVVMGKCKTVVKTVVVEQSLDTLSDGCLIKIADLRSEGKEPYFLNDEGKRIKIFKRLPSVGVYAECTPVHRPAGDVKKGKEVYHVCRKRIKKTEQTEIKYRELSKSQFEVSDVDLKRVVCRLIANDFTIENVSYKLLKEVYDRLWERNIPCALIGDKK